MAKSLSIHLGLNFVDPKHYDGWDGELRACEADANDMARLAKERGYGSATVLLTKHATVARFAKAMKDAAGSWSPATFYSCPIRDTAGRCPTATVTTRWTASTRPGVSMIASSLTTSSKVCSACSRRACG